MNFSDAENSMYNIISGFHNAIDVLCSTIFADPCFSFKLYGFGFGSTKNPLGMLQHIQDTETESEIKYFGIISDYGTCGYHILNNAIVTDNPIQLDKTSGNIVFHINSLDKNDEFELLLSSQTLTSLSQGNIKFETAVESIHSDPESEPKFHLSSLVANELALSYFGKLAITRPSVLFSIKAKTNSEMFVDGHHSENLGDHMQGLKSIFALKCPVWPEKITTWAGRHRGTWPPNQTIEEIMKKGTFLIPHENEDAYTQGLWQMCFTEAETCIVTSMGHLPSKVYLCIQGIVEVIALLSNIDKYTLHKSLTHSFFWYLEENYDKGDLNVDTEEEAVMTGLQEFIKYVLSESKFLHYFIPEVNTLRHVSETKQKQMLEIFQNMIDSSDFLEEVVMSTNFRFFVSQLSSELDESQKQTLLETMVNKTRHSCMEQFSGMIKLGYLNLFARLHQRVNIDECIQYHHDILHYITLDSKGDCRVKGVYQRLISSSLGNLYLKKAKCVPKPWKFLNNECSKPKESKHSKEIQYFHKRAEELLLTANNMDLIAGRVMLANYYYVSKRYEECFELVQEILKITGKITENDDSNASDTKERNPCVSEAQFTEEFLHDLINRNVILDILLSDNDKENVPAKLGKNLTLTTSQLVGMDDVPVYVVDSEIYLRFLYAMSAFKLGNPQLASNEVIKLENLCCKHQHDLNEKRNVAYYNMLAVCCLDLGEKVKGIELLQKSLAILPNLRNPARFLLLSLQTEKSRWLVQRGIYIAVGVAMTAGVLGLVRSKYL